MTRYHVDAGEGRGTRSSPSREVSVRVAGRSATSRRDPLLERDPRRERLALLPAERRADGDGVLALDAVARVEDPVGPRAVVRQEQEPLGVEVEAPHRVEARPTGREVGRDELEHRARGVAVGGG